MKTKRVLWLIASLGAAGALSAQSVQFVVLDRQVNYVQTAAGSAGLAGATPYEFVVDLNGTGLTSPDFTIVAPSTVVYSSFVRDPGKEWQAPAPEGAYQFASMAALHSVFPDGSYTIQTNLGNTSALSISDLIGTTNDGFGNTPFIIGTQDGNPVTWSGNKMLVDPTKQLTLTTTPFTTNNSSADNRIGLWLGGYMFSDEVTNETAPNSFVFSGTSVEMQISANMLYAGSTYSGGMEFNVVDGTLVNLTTPFGAGANGVAVYTAFTTFSIQAIPEPSTYASILGMLALAGVLMVRRRRAA